MTFTELKNLCSEKTAAIKKRANPKWVEIKGYLKANPDYSAIFIITALLTLACIFFMYDDRVNGKGWNSGALAALGSIWMVAITAYSLRQAARKEMEREEVKLLVEATGTYKNTNIPRHFKIYNQSKRKVYISIVAPFKDGKTINLTLYLTEDMKCPCTMQDITKSIGIKPYSNKNYTIGILKINREGNVEKFDIFHKFPPDTKFDFVRIQTGCGKLYNIDLPVKKGVVELKRIK